MVFDSVAPRLRPFLRACALPLALLLVFLYLVWRSKGAYPAVFADEWLYSSQARLLPFKDATLPSYLYLGVFHLTSACGAGFLDCARLFNSAFLVLAAPFLYQIARLVSSKPVAGALVLLSLLAPVNSYTSYFMPEAMYYCGFAIFSWAVLTLRDGAPWRYGLLCGSVLGLMSLVKIHALFLLPALLAFMLYLCGGAAPARRWRALASMSVCAVLAMVLTKSALAYLIAGPDGLNFLGSFYGGHARNSGGSAAMLLKLVGPALVSLRGHLLALLLLFAVPIAGIVLNRLQPRAVAEAGARGRDLAAIEVYALLMLGAAVVMTVAFTASVADAGPDELMRLHLRYYDFVFPLLLIGAAAPLGMPPRRAGWLNRLLGLPLAVLLLWACWLIAPYHPSLIDGPELAALGQSPAVLAGLTGLELLILLVWIVDRRRAAGLLLFLLMPLHIVAFEVLMHSRLSAMRVPNSYDSAGMMAHQSIPPAERGSVTVAGEGAGLTRALFQIDHAAAQQLDLVPNAALDHSQIPAHQRWLLVVGEHALPADMPVFRQTPQYRLLRLQPLPAPQTVLDFDRPRDSAVLIGSSGLAAPEVWGSWSTGPQLRLQFKQALPQALNVFLRARAFGPNTERDFVISVGGQRRSFRLSATVQDRVFQFQTDGRQRQLTIEVPSPTAPRSIGLGDDERLLGLGLVQLSLGDGGR